MSSRHISSQSEMKEWFTYRGDGRLLWRKPRRGSGRKIGEPAGSIRKDGYIEIGFKGRWLLHQLVYLYHMGYIPSIVDHKDQDVTNNRIENLRPASRSVNGLNSDKARGYYKNNKGLYIANIGLNNKTIYLGSFSTEHEASQSYEKAKQEAINKEN